MKNNFTQVKISFPSKLLAWFNIGIQVAFPLAAAFTPAISAAKENNSFLQRSSPVTFQTNSYTLTEGETTASIAQKYNISMDELRKLNQFRTFTRDFDKLQAGDELDIPTAPLSKMKWDNVSGTTEKNDNGSNAQSIAFYASRAGEILAQNPNGEAAASIARDVATGAASGEIEQWLNNFGTASVKLDIDNKFSLKNSSIDLLVPLYEKKDKLVFTQGSIHRTDDRTQSNLGIGYRWFSDDWMLGVNAFFDHDLSRKHSRVGFGGEYSRDFLKFGINSYHRLTDWKNATNLDDYYERPANGWDVRAQYWIPALPQLGGKLVYEQYYGNEVALFGKDNRQRNPHAITAGVNYTPVPLLTFSAEQRQGKAGKSDSFFGIQMNYQLGIPWSHQINPNGVAALRSLSNSKYDLVERNNNIVLEYLKKEVIHLKTKDKVMGYTGEEKSLGVSVTSKYGIARIDWSASELIAAGGKIVQRGEDWAVVMPDYRSDVNRYIVKGVAVDRKGNRSNETETQVTVQTPQVNAVQSTFTPTSTVLLANGRSTQTLTLKMKDVNGQPVNISVSDVEMTMDNVADASVLPLVSRGVGVAELTVTAGIKPTTLYLSPIVQGINLPVAKVNIIDNEPDLTHSSFTASPNIIPADNLGTTVLTIRLSSKDGLPVTGVKDKLSLMISQNNVRNRNNPLVILSDITEEQPGKYTATLKGRHAGVYTITPQYNDILLNTLSATVTLTAGSAAQSASEVLVNKASYVAGEEITVTAMLKDAQNNAVSGAAG
ncbi:hypothetical protein A3Q29_21020, partial [Providencia stuartii]